MPLLANTIAFPKATLAFFLTAPKLWGAKPYYAQIQGNLVAP